MLWQYSQDNTNVRPTLTCGLRRFPEFSSPSLQCLIVPELFRLYLVPARRAIPILSGCTDPQLRLRDSRVSSQTDTSAHHSPRTDAGFLLNSIFGRGGSCPFSWVFVKSFWWIRFPFNNFNNFNIYELYCCMMALETLCQPLSFPGCKSVDTKYII